MISFEEALRLIEENIRRSGEEAVPIGAALGRVCSKDVRSPLDLPLYDNSAMDGYLLRSEDTSVCSPETPVRLSIRGTIKAGDDARGHLRSGEAYRIMTGACLLKGADAVLEKESALVQNGRLVVSAPVPRWRHVRRKGEEIKKRELVLPKDSVVNPGTIGFLATMGMIEIQVYKKPAVSLIATGNELTPPGRPLRPGKIYDSNTAMVEAALEGMRIRPLLVRRLGDAPKVIRQVIRFALRHSDFVIFMGGVSVGDYDFVKTALDAEGVKTIFWKVRQKPGKPLYFGRKGDCLVFGLPGNPASVFTCFYEYAYPALRRFMGYKNPRLASARLKPAEPMDADPRQTTFVKSKTVWNGTARVSPLRHQKSHMISSLCEIDGFAVLPPSRKKFGEGTSVLVHSLPFSWEGAWW